MGQEVQFDVVTEQVLHFISHEIQLLIWPTYPFGHEVTQPVPLNMKKPVLQVRQLRFVVHVRQGD